MHESKTTPEACPSPHDEILAKMTVASPSHLIFSRSARSAIRTPSGSTFVMIVDSCNSWFFVTTLHTFLRIPLLGQTSDGDRQSVHRTTSDFSEPPTDNLLCSVLWSPRITTSTAKAGRPGIHVDWLKRYRRSWDGASRSNIRRHSA